VDARLSAIPSLALSFVGDQVFELHSTPGGQGQSSFWIAKLYDMKMNGSNTTDLPFLGRGKTGSYGALV
jgi:hypothetical protein